MIYIPMYIFSTPIMIKLLASLFTAVLAIVSLNLYSDRFHEDEYKADEYAASQYKKIDKFDEEPWEVLEKLTNNYREQKESSSNKLKKLLFKGVLHPPDEKRVENLKECMKEK